MLAAIKNALPLNIRIILGNYRKRITVRLHRLIRNLSFSGSRKKNSSKTVIVFSERGMHYTCGYYDVSPFFPNQQSLLILRTSEDYKPLKKRSVCEVGYAYFSGEFTGDFIKLAETDTWCWQQGCRLQWIPGAEGNLAIFNKSVSSKPGSAILDVKSGELYGELNCPIYAVSPNGQDAITLDFIRLGRMRPGYGYVGFFEDDKNIAAPANNGLWKLSLLTGQKELLISLSELSLLDPTKSMRGATHYLNHIAYNPSGTRVLFIHLWTKGSSRYSRLITMNPDGSNITILNNEGHASHYTWRNDNEILHYATHSNKGTGYYIYNDIIGGRKMVGQNILIEDGHPTFLSSKNCFITDTYPDRYSDQTLLSFDLKNDSITELGRFYHPPEYYGEVRCDLHPRVNNESNLIAIDVIKNKRRAVYVGNFLNLISGHEV